MPKHLIIICGPTASGKTGLSIALAKALNTEIISFDSRQFFREMPIGTASPNKVEMADIPHYFIQDRSVAEDFSAGKFEEEVIPLIEDLFRDHETLVAVGGSGLYMDAITKGFADHPEVPVEIRDKWNTIWQEKGISPLQSALKVQDPEYYERVDESNPHRLIRALELIEVTGKTYSQIRLSEAKARSFEWSKWAIDWPREELYARIDRRVLKMIEDGLVEEVRSLLPLRHKRALATVGYQEIFEYLDGGISLDRAIELIQRNSRRYAKRQLTWLRREKDVHWIPNDIPDNMLKQILS